MYKATMSTQLLKILFYIVLTKQASSLFPSIYHSPVQCTPGLWATWGTITLVTHVLMTFF